MNSAYLSELWAVNDLLNFKKNFKLAWSDQREAQLQDEKKHARMCLSVLKTETQNVIYSLDYAMQETIFKKKWTLGHASSDEEFSAIQEVMENRALWIYRTYLKVGKNNRYKDVFKAIILDEKIHRQIGKEKNIRFTPIYKSISTVDRYFFRTYLPSKYGQMLFSSPQFWNDYYQGYTESAKQPEKQETL